MENIIRQYANKVQELVEAISAEQEAFEKGAQLVAEAIKRDELIHVIGPGGHSNMAVEEVLWRAGGLAPINAILDPGTNVIHGAKRSNIIERCPGYGIRVLDSYGINRPGEVIIIVNAYGINSMTIDIALEAKRRGLKTIGITSESFARIVPKDAPSRHPSGLNLFENVEVLVVDVIDTLEVGATRYGERQGPHGNLQLLLNLLQQLKRLLAGAVEFVDEDHHGR